jgi:hypothetical protein
VKAGEVIEIVINNKDTGEHPLHLHGHWFWVMARGAEGDGPWEPKKEPLSKTPILRDTVTVNAQSYAVLRFVADNPGTWIFHCECREGGAAGPARAAGERGQLDLPLRVVEGGVACSGRAVGERGEAGSSAASGGGRRCLLCPATRKGGGVKAGALSVPLTCQQSCS